MKPLLDILIPTFNNEAQLVQCLNSIRMSLSGPSVDLVNIIVINNGHPGLGDRMKPGYQVTFIEAGGNARWEGGLKIGLAHSKAPFVVFCNDDIRMIEGQHSWFWQIMSTFNDPSVGAVGPSSNFVMGVQNIWHDSPMPKLEVPYLIGFFMVLRKSALEGAGGIDENLPGGDDIDLSIRLKDEGYRLICRRDVFVYHHGAQTGNRVHEGYWNSPVMQERTNLALVSKHGMLKFWQTVVIGWAQASRYESRGFANEDVEGNICRMHVSPGKVYELGCGGQKTVPDSIGIDLFPMGAAIPCASDEKTISVAGFVADVSVSLPIQQGDADTLISRHLLEHCVDPLGTLMVWNAALKMKGTLILAVPNHELGNTIVMNLQHVNTFTPDSLVRLARAAGFDTLQVHRQVNGVSFVAAFVKVKHLGLTDSVNPTKFPMAAELQEVA